AVGMGAVDIEEVIADAADAARTGVGTVAPVDGGGIMVRQFSPTRIRETRYHLLVDHRVRHEAVGIEIDGGIVNGNMERARACYVGPVRHGDRNRVVLLVEDV